MDSAYMETDYEKKRKRSDHRLRQVSKDEHQHSDSGREVEKQSSLEGYVPSEAEQKAKSAPKEQLLVRGGKERISAGYNKDKKLTIVFSRDVNDGTVKDQEAIKKEGSSTMKQDKLYLRSGTHNPEKSAVMLEDRDEKRKQFLMGRVRRSMDKQGDTLLNDSFSFLNNHEEKSRIHSLEDEARANSLNRKLVEENRSQASRLYQDLICKEQESRDFMKKLLSQVTSEKTGKKKSGLIPSFVSGFISALADGNDEDDESKKPNKDEKAKAKDAEAEDEKKLLKKAADNSAEML